MASDGIQEFFFIDGAGAQQGPVTAATIREYWQGSYVNEQTYVFAADGSMANWTLLPDCTALHGCCTQPAECEAAPAHESFDATSSGEGDGYRSALLSGIAGFNKAALKKTITADHSSLAISSHSSGTVGGGAAGADADADASSGLGDGGLLAELQRSAGALRPTDGVSESSHEVCTAAVGSAGGGGDPMSELFLAITARRKARHSSSADGAEEHAARVARAHVSQSAAQAVAEQGGSACVLGAQAASPSTSQVVSGAIGVSAAADRAIGACKDSREDGARAPTAASAAPPSAAPPSAAPPSAAPPVTIKEYSSWAVQATAEGGVYFYNTDSGETQWAKPEELKTAEVIDAKRALLLGSPQ